jgi:hypothetical protein
MTGNVAMLTINICRTGKVRARGKREPRVRDPSPNRADPRSSCAFREGPVMLAKLSAEEGVGMTPGVGQTRNSLFRLPVRQLAHAIRRRRGSVRCR